MAARDSTNGGRRSSKTGTATARPAARGAPRVRRKAGLCKREEFEALPFGLTQMVVWASDSLITKADKDERQCAPFAQTENVTVDLREMDAATAETLVHQDDPFEIRVVGCSAVSADLQLPFFKNANELVVYSLDCEQDPMTNDMHDVGVPRIHFHYKDQNSVKPDHYQAIPYSRSLVYQASAATKVESVAVRFKIMELDDVDKSVRDSIQGIGKLGSQVTDVLGTMPYLALLGPALDIAGEVGRMALDSYAKPDNVFSVDCGFKIAPREVPPHARPDEYLRYGYYFFLQDGVRSKLYASTTALNQIMLMTRRVPGSRRSSTSAAAARAGRTQRRGTMYDCMSCAGRSPDDGGDDDEGDEQQDFVPLTGVSYLVIKVGVPVPDAVGSARLSSSSSARAPKLTARMVRRLQTVIETAKDCPGDEVKRDIVAIMAELKGECRTGDRAAAGEAEAQRSPLDDDCDAAAAMYSPPCDCAAAAAATAAAAAADGEAEHRDTTPEGE